MQMPPDVLTMVPRGLEEIFHRGEGQGTPTSVQPVLHHYVQSIYITIQHIINFNFKCTAYIKLVVLLTKNLKYKNYFTMIHDIT